MRSAILTDILGDQLNRVKANQNLIAADLFITLSQSTGSDRHLTSVKRTHCTAHDEVALQDIWGTARFDFVVLLAQ